MRVRLGDYIKEYSVKNKNNEDIPVYSVSNSLGFCKDYFGKEVASKNKTTYKIVPRGCFAYNPSRINVGSVDWQNEEERVIVSPLYNVFSISPLLDQQYLLYYLKSNVTLARIKAVASGSVRDNLKLSMLYEFPIDLISLDQQYEVVSILNAIQKIIDLYQKELSGLDELVRARFVEMFGDPNIEFKYNSIKFNDLVVRMTKGPFGSDMKKDLFVPKGEDTYKVYIQINAIQKNQSLGEYYISKEYFDRKVSRFELFPNDYIITCDGTLGKYLKLDKNMEKGVISPSLLRLTLQSDKINDKYFENIWDFYMLGLMKKEARNACLVHLPSAKKIGEISIPIPPLELQNQFASFVQEIDKSRSRIQKSLEASQELFDSLMQEYFG